jgi:XTP/dITP diphosphohydrolase
MAQPLGRVVVATRNPGKLREFQALLGRAGWRVEGLPPANGSEEPQETGASYAENARIKALHASRSTPLPVLADDSGLEVEALAGRPGVRSARYAGPDASDGDNRALLLAELRGAPARDARFVCALALARSGAVLHETEGECRGVIVEEPRGVGGFGYDPLFLVPDLGLTFAELAPDAKNRISHRARAVDALLARLDDRLPENV